MQLTIALAIARSGADPGRKRPAFRRLPKDVAIQVSDAPDARSDLRFQIRFAE